LSNEEIVTKYEKIAQDVVDANKQFSKDVEKAIKNKELNTTLSMLAQKATSQQATFHLSNTDTMDLAFAIFMNIFGNMRFPDDVKQKMANTIRKKLQEAVAQMPPPTEVPETSVEISPTSPIDQGDHINLEKYGNLANDALSSNPSAKSNIENAIKTKDLKQTLTLVAQLASTKKAERHFSDLETMEFAFEIFYVIFDPMPFSPEVRTKMITTVKAKLLGAVKSESPEMPANPTVTSSAPMRPKVFSSSTLGLGSGSNSVAENSTPATTPVTSGTGLLKEVNDEEQARLEREMLRKSRQKGESATSTDKSTPTAAPDATFDASSKIDQWLRDDGKLMKQVEKIDRVGPKTIRITFDPESDGYLAWVEIEYTGLQYGTNAAIRLTCSGYAKNRYPVSLAIGDNGKKWAVAALYDMNASNMEQNAIAALRNVDFKNQLDWDRLQLLLFKDNEVIGKIKKLLLKNPVSTSKEEIPIPVFILNENPAAKIVVNTFLNPSLKASIILIELMDKIAEDIEQLGSTTADTAAGSINSALGKNTKPIDMTGHQFHFLQKDDQVNFKSCPYCGRPYPDPRADYYRCPNCLAKLK